VTYVNSWRAVDVLLAKSGLSRDDDLDLNLNELNLACLDEPVENQGIGGGVLGASANFSPSGILTFCATTFFYCEILLVLIVYAMVALLYSTSSSCICIKSHN